MYVYHDHNSRFKPEKWRGSCLQDFYLEKFGVLHFEVEDNVIPAANSVMASNLFHLSVYFEYAYFEKTFF